MSNLAYITVTMENTGPCPTCGCPVYLPENLASSLRKSQRSFYCPSGHPQSFRVSETETLRKQLEAEKKRREWAESDAKMARESRDTARKAEAIVRGKLRATEQRVGNGVCPCCRRNFTNLRRHMATKHPEYSKAGDSKPERKAGRN